MKIYVAHSRNFDFQNELYEPIRQSELSKMHTFFLPHDGTGETKTKEIIKNSDLIIAETSLPATGMGIELGWADAFNVPILAFYKEGIKPSISVQYVARKSAPYKDPADLIFVIEQEIKNYGA